MSKQRVKIHQFDPVIYPFRLWVAITADGEALKERFKEGNFGKELKTTAINTSEALTYYVQQKEEPTYWGVLIIFMNKKYCTARTMAHEATHAARFVWEHINEDPTGEEADAYLVGWIAQCIEEVKNYKHGQATESIS